MADDTERRRLRDSYQQVRGRFGSGVGITVVHTHSHTRAQLDHTHTVIDAVRLVRLQRAMDSMQRACSGG